MLPPKREDRKNKKKQNPAINKSRFKRQLSAYRAANQSQTAVPSRTCAPKPKSPLQPPKILTQEVEPPTDFLFPAPSAGSESCSSVGSSSSSLSRPQLPLPAPPPTWSTVPSLPLIGPPPPLPSDAVKTVLPSQQLQPPNQEVANYYVLPLEASGILVGPHAGEQVPCDWFPHLWEGGAKCQDSQ